MPDSARHLARSRQAASPPALFFVDEAYADFSGETLIDAATLRGASEPGVGRTFSKAYGLAGLRAGALVGAPGDARAAAPGRAARTASTPGPRPRSPSRSPTAPTATGISNRSAASRALLFDALRAARAAAPGRAPRTSCWCGSATRRAVVAGLAARGVRVRDRSKEHGCAGCVRITAGLVEDTRRAIAALEEVLCAARVIDRKTTRNLDPPEARHRRARPLRRLHRHPVLRSHAGAGRAARRVRSDAEGGRRSRRRPASHRRGRRHRARRSGRRRRSARAGASIAPATS